MAELSIIDAGLKVSAHDELQARMATITKQVATRRFNLKRAREEASNEEAAIVQLLRLHDEYQTIVGRSLL